MPIAKAQNDPTSFFENARDQLLSSCNSQIISHSAVILGLIIAMATVGKDAIKAITTKKLWKHFLGFGSIAFAILLALYESARLFYYTDVSSRLISINNSALGIDLTNSTNTSATEYILRIDQYATIYPKNASLSPTSQLAQLLSPNHPLVIPILFSAWILSLFISFVVTRQKGKRN